MYKRQAIGWLQTVVENGTVRMGSAIMAVIFGAWLGLAIDQLLRLLLTMWRFKHDKWLKIKI